MTRTSRSLIVALLALGAVWLIAMSGFARATPFVVKTYHAAVGGAGNGAVGAVGKIICPSAKTCVFLGVKRGDNSEHAPAWAVTFDPINKHSRFITGGFSLGEASSGLEPPLACPLVTQCTIAGLHGEVTFNPLAPGTPHPVKVIDPRTLEMPTACPPEALPGSRCTVITKLTDGLGAIACPTPSECISRAREEEGPLGGANAVVTFNPHSPSPLTPVDIALPPTPPLPANLPPDLVSLKLAEPGLLGEVACPSATLCVEVEFFYRLVTFNPKVSTPLGISAPIPMFDAKNPLHSPTALHYRMRCPSASLCVALSNTGLAVVFDPATPSSVTSAYVDDFPPTAFDCPSVHQCDLLDNAPLYFAFAGRTYTRYFDPSVLQSSPRVNVDVVQGSRDIACPSVTQCTIAGSDAGRGDKGPESVVTFNPHSPGTVCLVPRVTGKTLSQANSLLVRSHCRLGAVSGSRSGTVVKQKFPATTTLFAGSRVSVALR
jgi:hypothetical protein